MNSYKKGIVICLFFICKITIVFIFYITKCIEILIKMLMIEKYFNVYGFNELNSKIKRKGDTMAVSPSVLWKELKLGIIFFQIRLHLFVKLFHVLQISTHCLQFPKLHVSRTVFFPNSISYLTIFFLVPTGHRKIKIDKFEINMLANLRNILKFN